MGRIIADEINLKKGYVKIIFTEKDIKILDSNQIYGDYNNLRNSLKSTLENISIENHDKIAAIGALIRETCDDDIHRLVRLIIFLHLNSQAKYPVSYASVLEKNYLDGEVNEAQKLLARIEEKLHM